MKARRRPWTLVVARWAPLLAGGMALQVVETGGCNPQVKTALLTGIQSSLTTVVTSVIQAFFTALAGSGGSGTTSQPIVKAVVHAATSWFA